MNNKYIIRKTEKDEYSFTENLTREAFWNVYKPGCDEHFVLHNFRRSDERVDDLDCVLIDGGEILAHIVYCKVKITASSGDEKQLLMFGPVSVVPDRQKKGYGSAIITETLKMAKNMGYKAVVITGNPDYYHRFGFISASSCGVHYPNVDFENEAPFFMIKLLDEAFTLSEKYVLSEPACYAVDAAELDKFEEGFPTKIKEKRPGQLA